MAYNGHSQGHLSTHAVLYIVLENVRNDYKGHVSFITLYLQIPGSGRTRESPGALLHVSLHQQEHR